MQHTVPESAAPNKENPTAMEVPGDTQRGESAIDADGLDRRNFLSCMAWVGTGLLWTINGGVPHSSRLQSTAASSDMIPRRREASLSMSSGSSRPRPREPRRSDGVLRGSGGPISSGLSTILLPTKAVEIAWRRHRDAAFVPSREGLVSLQPHRHRRLHQIWMRTEQSRNNRSIHCALR